MSRPAPLGPFKFGEKTLTTAQVLANLGQRTLQLSLPGCLGVALSTLEDLNVCLALQGSPPSGPIWSRT